jgi:hypothetical protein
MSNVILVVAIAAAAAIGLGINRLAQAGMVAARAVRAGLPIAL